jgi:hypothetical protein
MRQLNNAACDEHAGSGRARGRRSTVKTNRVLVAAGNARLSNWMIREARRRQGGQYGARLRTFVGQLKDVDMAGVRPRLGRGLFEFADCLRTVRDRGLAVYNPWPLPRRGRGLTEITDCSWTWTVQVRGMSAPESSPPSGQCCGHCH